MVQQGAEGEPVPPGGGEVGDLHPTVVLGHFTTPDKQGLTGIGLPSQNWTGNRTGLQREREERVKRLKIDGRVKMRRVEMDMVEILGREK